MDIDPERPQVVKFSPEIGTPTGQGTRWPVWLVLVFLVLVIAFVAWTQTLAP